MDRTEFRRLVRHGLGRAVLHLQQNDPTTFREIVVAACLGDDIIETAGRDYWEDATGWALHGVLWILSQVDDPRVRELAIELRQRTDWWRSYWIPLLLPTYGPDDQPEVEAAIQSETDEEIVHGWGINLMSFCEKELHLELIPALFLIYERTPCALCRGDVIKLLHQLDSLPASIIEECHHDSNKYTREFVASLSG